MRPGEFIGLLMLAGILSALGLFWYEGQVQMAEEAKKQSRLRLKEKDCISFGFPSASIDSNGEVYCVRRIDGSDVVVRLNELIDLESGSTRQ